jgi:methionyl-tRNA formyltransferase
MVNLLTFETRILSMSLQNFPKIVLCGTVQCTKHIAQKLIQHGANLVGIAGVAPEFSSNISGYTNMEKIADAFKIPYFAFKNINDTNSVNFIHQCSPDVLFVTGLSQLVKKELLEIPRVGTVGFHPTPLPQGRGRAPIAWLTHDRTNGAATFFLLGNGVDDGAIFVQEQFAVNTDDHASEVESKMLEALDRALDRWLPRFVTGEWNPIPQDESLATYNEIRKPDDGIIDWHQTDDEIYSHIRATSRPHPGAYTFVNDNKLIIWRAQIDNNIPIRGIVGRILRINEEKQPLVQTGRGLIRLIDFEWESSQYSYPQLRVGTRLGYVSQNEIFDLRQRVTTLENIVKKMTPQNNITEYPEK